MNKLKSYIDYSKHYLRMIFIYIFISLLITIFLNEKLLILTNTASLLLIILSVTFAFLLYYFLRKRINTEISITKVEFGNYDYKFLSVKIFEILLQQFLVILLLTLGKQFLGENYILIVILVFVLLHFQLLLFHTLRFTLYYILFSIPAILIFSYIYLNLGSLSLGLAFLLHLSFYLVLGLLDLNGRISKFIE